MSRRSSLQSTRHRTRKRTKVRSTYKTGECLQFSVCLQALSCFFCVPEKRPRCRVAAICGTEAGDEKSQYDTGQSVSFLYIWLDREDDRDCGGHRSLRSLRTLQTFPAWSSTRGPCPQVLQWHPRVAKRASIGTLARGPSTEALLGQGRVSKERESVPLTGLWSGSRPGLARHPRLQVVLRHPGVAKGTSIGTSARQPYQQAPHWHPRGATVSWCIG